MLIVDDNKMNHEALKVALTPDTVEDTRLSELEKVLFETDESQTSGADKFVEPDYHIDDAYSGEESLDFADRAAAEGMPYSLIFMDVRMPPGMDGIQAVKAIWQRHKNVQVVICSAYTDYSWDEIIRELGISDNLAILQKPFVQIEVKQIAMLLTRKWQLANENAAFIHGLEEMISDRTKQLEIMVEDMKSLNSELEQKNTMLEAISKKDGLTGLFNHSALNEQLQIVFAEGQRFNFSIAVSMFDIDNFKHINDNYGHLTGDECLRKVAEVLTSFSRKTDWKYRICETIVTPDAIKDIFVAGRYGGDEFVMIFTYCSHEDLDDILSRVADGIREIELTADSDYKVTSSIGAAVCVPGGQFKSETDLLDLADKALYVSKEAGKNRYTILNQEEPSP